jgi:hypothetical protein
VTPQEELQAKTISLQAASGDLIQAKVIFDWLVERSVEAQVQVLIQRYLASQQRAE